MSISPRAALERPAAVATPDLICYRTEADPPKLLPGRPDRQWMDLTDQRYAYRCIPLSIANATGWEIVLPCSFSATWTGGALTTDIQIRPIGAVASLDARVISHFGHGVLTFHTGYLFRTSPGWALWCRGAPNMIKHGIVPLDGLVETDWLPFPFTMNWRFTRPGTVRFDEGEVFCFLTPVPHALYESIEPVMRSLDDDPGLKAAYEGWSASRTDFNASLARNEPETVKQGWQRHYVKGAAPEGEAAAGFHLSRRRLKPPRP
ncbi:MAG: DUF6065 family protein [Hyphomicrobiales bacterium]